jgi:hypothetical protein
MTIDPAVIPGLLLLGSEFLALATVGYVVARVALRQSDDRLALASGLVIGLALWGLIVNFVLHLFPGLAGALAGWIVLLALGAGLAWRQRQDLWVSPRTIAGFGVAGAAIFWIALASRQLLIIPDHLQHTLIPATIRAGNWPPRLPWNPDLNLAYHYGVDLIAGLLTPPTGPDLSFTTEVLGAYVWASLILLVGTLLLRHGSLLGTLTLMPLLLSAGAWTLVFGDQPSVLQIPVPGGIPEAGLRASLTDVYWPRVELPWPSEQHTVPPNIWKPSFPLAYALALVLLERFSHRRYQHWSGTLALAGLIGFLGLVDEAVAGVVLALWVVIEASRRFNSRRTRTESREALIHSAAGPTLGAVLLFGGGGLITGIITERSTPSGLSLGFPLDPRDRSALISVTTLPGGLGLLQVGCAVVAALAAILERRSRLILALAAGSATFLLAALTIRFEVASYDIGRLDGHARNFALLAVLFLVGKRLSTGRVHWRFAAAAAILFLVTWPTVATPARQLGIVASRGVQLANAEPGSREFDDWYWWMGRYALLRFPSDPVAAWIRDHTESDARVLSPFPYAMTVATGRPNASGFRQYVHLIPYTGPEYLDAIRHLEPEALKHLDVRFLHATDAWIADLPDRARRWLANPAFFDLLARDGTHSLYGVKPEFHTLSEPPSSGSFEAIRQAAPTGAKVYVSPALEPLNAFRAMAMLTHTNLLVSEDQTVLNHLRVSIQTEPLGAQTPDLVLTSSRLAPSMFAPNRRGPVWWNEDVALFSPSGSVAPVSPHSPDPFRVQLSDSSTPDQQLVFTAILSNDGGDRWTGQDWVVVPVDDSPWAIPRIWPIDKVPQWFAGQIAPQSGTIIRHYEFDPGTATLALRDQDGNRSLLPSAGEKLNPGAWLLGVRLRDDYRLTAFIPAVRFVISQTGKVSFHVYEGELSVTPSLGSVGEPNERF